MDDGAFRRTQRWAPVAAVAAAAPDRVEAVEVGWVRVDGRDATDVVLQLVRRTGGLESLQAVLVDGVVVGGFNVIDLDRLHRSLGVPVVAVTYAPPDFPRIRKALRTWFGRDAARRWRLLRRHRLFAVPPPGPPVLLAAVGCTRTDAVRLLRRTVVRGHRPEVLRLAHLVASAAGQARRPPNRRVMRRGAGRPSGL